MAVPAVLSLITLGVADVRASTRFYQALGFPLSSSSVEGEVSFFRTAGGLLAVWSADELRKDAGLDASATTGRYRESSLAINVASREAVDDALATAVAAGAQITRAAQPTDWGGYNGYFADPDGHLWEIAHNPFWPLRADGLPELPD
jgi:predicted lactoylglutathione lyase